MSDVPTAEVPGSEPSTPFLGRGHEMGVLVHALESAASGRGRVVLVSGEAGIGKTRLADTFTLEAGRRGAIVVWGRCWEAGGAPVYWPWRQAIRAYLPQADPIALARALGPRAVEVAKVVPELRNLLADLPEAPVDETDSGRFRLFEATSSLLRAAAAQQPLVLVLDDLHGADEPSLLLLRFVAYDLRDSRLLVVANYREDELAPGDARPAILTDVGRSPAAVRLTPHGLTEPDIATYIASLTTTPDSALAHAVHAETEGNPLFVGEILRLLNDEGRLGGKPDATGRPLRVPEGIRAVIGRRLVRLSGSCRRLLADASVVGVDVPLELLARVEGRAPESLVELLEEAVVARVVTPTSLAGSRWRFDHSLVREVLYAGLPIQERIQLHHRIGEALEALHDADPDPPLGELAHHFFNAAVAGDVDKAVDYARRAGEQATRLLAYEEGARLFRMALEAAGLRTIPDHRERCELLLALGDAQARAGDESGSQATFLEAANLGRRIGLDELLALAALGYGGRVPWTRAGADQHVIPLLEEGLAALPDGESELRSRMLARLSGAMRDDPNSEPRESISRQAVAMAERLADPSTLAYTLEAMFSATWTPDNLAERFALAERIIALGQATGDRERHAAGRMHRLHLFFEQGDISSMAQERADFERLAEQLRQPMRSWFAVGARALFAQFEGRFEDAERLMTESFELGRHSHRTDAIVHHTMQLFALRREQGRLAEIELLVRSAAREFTWYPMIRCALALLLDELGRESQARAEFEALAARDFAAIPFDNEWLFGMSLASEVAYRLGDGRRAGAMYEALLPYAERNGLGPAEGCTGSMHRPLALLASAASMHLEARSHFERAIVRNEEMGARPWLAHALHEFALMLIDLDEPGDVVRAVALLGRAQAICDELGMPALGTQVRRALPTAGVAKGREPSAAGEVGTSSIPRRATFHREADYWAIEFDRLFRIRDSKGLRYLAQLLSAPGREFHVLDLAARLNPSAVRPGAVEMPRSGELRVDAGDSPVMAIDEEARAAYRARLRELQGEIDEAQSFNDPMRGEHARAEIELLESELAAAFGLGGRQRASGSPADRARQSVTKAIRATMRRIGREDAALGDHLVRSVHTGIYSVYDPDPAAAPLWEI